MSNLAAQLVLTAYLGETRTFSGTHQTSEDDDTVKVITGWPITVTIKQRATTISLSGTIVSETADTYTWTITAANTVSLGVRDCNIDI